MDSITASFYLYIFLVNHPWIAIALMIWALAWKGAALWKAARRNEPYWFVALLLVNTVGLLEAIYLFGFAKRKAPKIPVEAAERTPAHAEHVGTHAPHHAGTIAYDDFAKVQLKVAKIAEAERVEKSEKLVKLQLEVGEEKRQILAGIGKAYTPEELIGKEIVIVANLEPKKLMGQESHGMLLAAGGDHPVLLAPEREVPSGAKVR